MKKVLITTAIDYTNDVVHIGHAYQKIVADCLSRYYRLKLGKDNIFFLTGTDEHGGNIEQAAEKKGKNTKDFVDEIVEQDKKQWETLNISYDRFIRTTDEDHKKTVEEFWRKSLARGDIYKGTFRGMYCLGCESYKTTREIVEGRCPLHKTKELQEIKEHNYFFRWTKYKSSLEELLEQPSFVYPSQRLHEMQSFLTLGIEDIPISRPREKISWGIPLPDDPTQTIYVWFDALINYYTAGKKEGFWDKDTEIIHIIGKDNLRWHSLLWPAMLHSVSERLPDQIYAHGFINLNGQKISKSLGNVIRPDELVKQFGADAVRYFFLKYGPAIEDVDISVEKIKSVYNSELADGWGNLVARVAKLAAMYGWYDIQRPNQLRDGITPYMDNFQLPHALGYITKSIKGLDRYLDRERPWQEASEQKKNLWKITIGSEATTSIKEIAEVLLPFMPETSKKILKQFSQEKIKAEKPYFPRLSVE